MTKVFFAILFYFCFCFFPCFAQPVIKDSTAETNSLLHWLSFTTGRIAIGGQHIANESGWEVQQKISGFQPLVFGVEYRDFGGIEKDIVYWEWSRKLVLNIFKAGGIVTIVDHMPNFATGGSSKDKNIDLPSELLPGGKYSGDYNAYLDRFSLFAQTVTVNGVRVPIIYRPFHEMNGAWFWWGKSPRFKELWRYTFNYLTKTKGLKNILWAWSPNIEAWEVDKMINYWPGPDYVDIVGLDGYSNGDLGSFSEPTFRASYLSAIAISDASGKPFVWSETGFEKSGCNRTDFWTNDFLKSIDDFYKKAKYALIWNGGYGPRATCPSSGGFKEIMSNTSKVAVLGRIDPLVIYGDGYKAVRQ